MTAYKKLVEATSNCVSIRSPLHDKTSLRSAVNVLLSATSMSQRAVGESRIASQPARAQRSATSILRSSPMHSRNEISTPLRARPPQAAAVAPCPTCIELIARNKF
ncbi:hypothetical protein EVAR_13315_1 [Eumeta japonica]|uniref:Uncharacterized protein n=1 Tax=Eumeta variegata TaxID=151549 RepID=A0A4C1TRR5_EUMVA|nr:hypothetical protein EVAR_13315_1 [Eumeta japonica]